LTTAGGEEVPLAKKLSVLAVDMDGTLTTDGRPPESELVEMLNGLKAHGTKLVLATGRCVREVYAMVGRSLFDGVVAENGAVLVVGETKKVMAPSNWGGLRADLLRHFEPGCEEVIISAESMKADAARRLIHGSVASVELNKDRLMIVPRGVNKGEGLREVLSMLDLKREATACIGDGENDLPMFDLAGVKVALENSVDALKLKADFVAVGGDGEGTKDAIRKLFGDGRGGTEARAART
jgi:hydroxymethylpyrimidine pyrophosphatase-like HAD family hydrolase